MKASLMAITGNLSEYNHGLELLECQRLGKTNKENWTKGFFMTNV